MNKKKSKVLAFLLATAMLVPSANGIVSAAEVVKNVTSIEENKRAEKVVDVSTEEEFLNAVKDNSIKIININSNIDLAQKVGILNIAGKTINLGGNTIMTKFMNSIFDGEGFILKNGIIESKADYPLYIGDEIGANNSIIENIKVKGGINIYNSHNVRLRNVEAIGKTYYAIWCDQNAQVIVESGEYKSGSNTVIGMTDVDTKLEINGGNFISADKPLVLEDNDNPNKYNNPIISGGKYDKAVDKIYLAPEISIESEKGGVFEYHKSIETVPDGSNVEDVENKQESSNPDAEKKDVIINYNDGSNKTFNKKLEVKEDDSNRKYITFTFENMSRSGYNFRGWKYNGKIYGADEEIKIYLDEVPIGESINVLAQWEKVQIPSIPSKPIKPTYDHTSIIGSDRYETAGKIADKLGSYDTAVLVNATSTMSDGLSAAGLAGKEDASILLVKKDSIPKATMDRLKKVRKVYIIGGENAISQKVVNQLKKNNVKVNIERLGGKTRVETSELVAKEIGNYKKAFVVNGFKGEADAMSASSVAAREEAPILLTNGKSSSTDRKSGVTYYVVGGKSVMNDSIVKKYKAERVAGDDRYETNREVINEFYGASETLYFANGETLVDALTASTIAKDDGLVLVGRKSDNKILNKKNTIQVGGMKFDVDFEK